MPRTSKVATLENDLETITRKKGKFLQESRAESAALTQELNAIIAKEKVQAKFDKMSDAEKAAMKEALEADE